MPDASRKLLDTVEENPENLKNFLSSWAASRFVPSQSIDWTAANVKLAETVPVKPVPFFGFPLFVHMIFVPSHAMPVFALIKLSVMVLEKPENLYIFPDVLAP